MSRRRCNRSVPPGAACVLAALCAVVPVAIAPGQDKPATKRRLNEIKLTRKWADRVDRSVEQGLAWLAAQQNPRGFWGGLIGAKGRGGYAVMRPIEEQRRDGTGHLGVTAICGMAFLAGGHLPGRSRYGEVVRKSVDAVLSTVQESGLLTHGGTRMYSHAFATLFLAEIYGAFRDPRIKRGLERAIHMIVDCQNRYGGWRYNAFQQDADLSVTVCQLQALRAARNIGIQVPKSVVDRAVEYIRNSQVTDGYAAGRYHYSTSGGRGRSKLDHYSIQAAAVTSLVSAGTYDAALIGPALEFLEAEYANVTANEPHHYDFWYGNYYASQAFFHAEHVLRTGVFQRYYDELSFHLIGDQQPDGRWINDVGPGDAYATGSALILLQIPNQYLPIFQR